MNFIALAEVAFDAGKHEAVGQLTQDGMLLDQIYEQVGSGGVAALSKMSRAQVKQALPALTRTLQVLTAMSNVDAELEHVMAALKGL